MVRIKTILKIIVIYACYLTQGVFQELIYNLEAGNGQRYKYPFFLVTLTTCCSTISALLATVYEKKTSFYLKALKNCIIHLPQTLTAKKTYRTAIEQGKTRSYNRLVKLSMLAGLTYCTSMVMSNFALTKVSYLLQQLVKSSKAIPVVLGGYLLFGRRYHLHEYVATVIIITSLMLYQAPRLLSLQSRGTSVSGAIALFSSLLCDGITGPLQDNVIKEYHIHSLDLMLFLNVPSVIYLASILSFTELKPVIAFLSSANWYMPLWLVGYAVLGAIGQLTLLSILNEFGSLTMTLITTIRKFLTVFLSVVVFRHSLHRLQWVSISLLLSSCFTKQGVLWLQSPNKFGKRN